LGDGRGIETAAKSIAGDRLRALKHADGLVSAVLEVGGLSPEDAAALQARVRAAVETAPGVSAVRIVTTADRRPEPAAAKPAAPAPAAPRPDRVIAVASGKGGVGKSTVSANLAIALARIGRRAGLLDADIHGPSAPMLLGLTGRARLEAGLIAPLSAHGIAVLSMGLMADPGRAVAWRGPMASSAFKQMLDNADWSGIDTLVIDMPPGTGDITLTLAQQVKPDGVVIVSTPQDLALIDAERALNLFQELGTPILGFVENMASFRCPCCGTETRIFGEGGVERAAAELGLPVLARLPLDPALRAASDAGTPQPSGHFDALAHRVMERLEVLDEADVRR